MHYWAYRARASVDEVRAVFESVMHELGFVVVDGKGASLWTWVVADGTGGTLITSTGFQHRDAVIQGLARRLRPARTAAIELHDVSVTAERGDIAADGSLGGREDVDELAAEVLEEWHEGGKYRSESAEPLLEVLLDIDGDPQGGVRIAWKGSARVQPAGLPAPAADVPPSPPSPPSPYRAFRHADGRRWQVRVAGDRLELRLSPDGVDWSERSRRSPAPQRDADALIADQLRDGFVEE